MTMGTMDTEWDDGNPTTDDSKSTDIMDFGIGYMF